MKLLTPICVVVLTTLATRVSGQQFTCLYDGQTYQHSDQFQHSNGCAKLQCQFGQIIPIYEACGKELDGECHPIFSAFVLQGDTYQCVKYSNNGLTEYHMDIIIHSIKGCTVEGQDYDHLQIFTKADGCNEYQCQDGMVIHVRAKCGKELDGQCHFVGEWFMVGEQIYECTQRKENGKDVFENVVLANPPDRTRACMFPASTYQHMDIWLSSCRNRQCQDGKAPIVGPGCQFGKDDSCHAVGEQWEYDSRVYGCWTFVNDRGQTLYVHGTVDDPVSRCKLGERWYNHLEYQQSPDGCQQRQCIDGTFPSTTRGCTVNGECKLLNSLWTSGSYSYVCLDNNGGWKVRVVDENGNVIEPNKPVLESGLDYEPDGGCPVVADIYFVIDSSGSIGPTNYEQVLQFAITISSIFKLGPQDVRFGLIIFSGDAQKVFGLGDIETHEELEQAISEAPYLWNITETQKAFDMIVTNKLFSTEQGGRETADDIVIVMTDGNSTSTPVTLEAADRLKALGALIMTVGVGNIKTEELYGMASIPENAFNAPDFTVLDTLLAGVSRRACESPDEPPVEPPKPVVKTCDSLPADIIFLVDSSGSIGDEAFGKGLQFIVDITKSFKLGPDDIQVGVVVYSTFPTLEFKVDEFPERNALTRAIQAIEYQGYSTRTYAGLDFIREEGLFTPANGGRDDANHIVIVMTDGKSSNTVKTLAAAQYLRSQKTAILSVGIAEADDAELVGMAGSSDNVFRSATYELLNYIQKYVTDRACNATVEEPEVVPPPMCEDFDPSLCAHICTNTETGFECSCNPGYAVNATDPYECEEVDECADEALNDCDHNCTNTEGSFECSCRDGYYANPENPHECLLIPCEDVIKADIIFVMDSSGSIKIEHYNKTFFFVNKVVRAFKLGPDDVRVGAIIFSYHVEKLFDLKDYDDYEDVYTHLLTAPYFESSTYTHQALKWIGWWKMFDAENGGRDDAEKLIILITDGKSNRPDKTLAEANNLKSQGITILTIGIGPNVYEPELVGMASSPDDVFRADNYDVLTYIEGQVAQRTCTVPSRKRR